MGEIIAGILAAVLAAFGFTAFAHGRGVFAPAVPRDNGGADPNAAGACRPDLFLDEARHGARRRGYMPQVLIDRRLLVGMPGGAVPGQCDTGGAGALRRGLVRGGSARTGRSKNMNGQRRDGTMQEERNGMPGTDDTGGGHGGFPARNGGARHLYQRGIPGTRYATSGWRTATW